MQTKIVLKHKKKNLGLKRTMEVSKFLSLTILILFSFSLIPNLKLLLAGQNVLEF